MNLKVKELQSSRTLRVVALGKVKGLRMSVTRLRLKIR